MPIVFAPADPVGAAAQSSYAQYLQRQQAAELALKRESLYLNAQNDFARTAVGLGEQRARAADMQSSQDFSRQQLEASRLPSPRDAYMADAQMAEQQQRYQLSAWAQQQEMSFAEQQRLSRLKASLGFWQQQKGTLSDDEYYDGLSKLQTGISPLQQKYLAAEAQAKDAETQRHREQGKALAAEAKAFEQTQTSSGPKMFPVTTPDGRQAYSYFASPSQGWKVFEPKNTHTERALDEAKVMAELVTYADKAAKVRVPAETDPDTGKEKLSDFVVQNRADYAQQILDYHMAEYRSRRDRGVPGAPGGGPPSPVPGAAPAAAGGAGGGPPGGTIEAPEQRQQRVFKLVNGYQEIAAAVEARADLPPEKRSEYAEAGRLARYYITTYGSADEMPPEIRKKFEQLAAVLRSIPPAPAPAPRPTFRIGQPMSHFE